MSCDAYTSTIVAVNCLPAHPPVDGDSKQRFKVIDSAEYFYRGLRSWNFVSRPHTVSLEWSELAEPQAIQEDHPAQVTERTDVYWCVSVVCHTNRHTALLCNAGLKQLPNYVSKWANGKCPSWFWLARRWADTDQLPTCSSTTCYLWCSNTTQDFFFILYQHWAIKEINFLLQREQKWVT